MKVQQIKAEIERWKKELRLSTSCEAKYRREMLDDISEFIDLLQEEPVSGDLEEAADLYYEEYCPYDGEAKVVNNIHDVYFPSQAIGDAFIAGANWQKEQMMKDAIPAKVVNDEDSGCVIDCEYGCLYLPSHAYDFTDKVKIIIVKKN
jgi:hypothetical protein